jgi:hypothetical protein
MTNQPDISAISAEPDWKTIAEDLADSLLDFNHSWPFETRGSMHNRSHEAMVAYFKATGYDWRLGRIKVGLEVCECHP